MPEITTLLSILKGVSQSSGLLVGWWKQRNALQRAEDYLERKYEMRIPTSTRQMGIMSAGATSQVRHLALPYHRLAERLSRQVAEAKEPGDTVRIACGDLALALFVLKKETFCRYGRLYGSETWDSLHAMSRGLGDAYALGIIKREIGEAMRKGCTRCS